MTRPPCERGERIHERHHPDNAGGPLHAETAGPAGGPLVLLLHATRRRGTRGATSSPPWARPAIARWPPTARLLLWGAAGSRQGPRRLRDRSAGPGRPRLADAAAGPGERFHLVGHDWGGHVSWVTAHRHPRASARWPPVASAPRGLPARVPGERRRAAASLPPPQDLPRSDYRPPAARGRGAPATGTAQRAGRGPRPRWPSTSPSSRAGGLEAALAWYRAAGNPHRGGGGPRHGADAVTSGATPTPPSAPLRPASPPISSPAPFRFEVLPGIGHFVTDQDPEAVTHALLSHLAPSVILSLAVGRRSAGAPTTEDSIVATDLKIWMNGRLVPRPRPSCPSTARPCSTRPTFRGLRAYWNEADGELYCFRLAEHFARLRESMKMNALHGVLLRHGPVRGGAGTCSVVTRSTRTSTCTWWPTWPPPGSIRRRRRGSTSIPAAAPASSRATGSAAASPPGSAPATTRSRFA